MEMADDNRVSGHASVFNQLADIGPSYEEMAPHAFDEVLRRDEDVRFLLNHNPDHLLGRTTSGTLRLSKDQTGLGVEDDLPDTSLGRDVRVLIRRGDLTGFSFGFAPDEQSDTFRLAPDGKQIRTRNNVARLADASIVTYPAYNGANDAVLRSVDFSKSTGNSLSNRDRLIRARAAGYHKIGR
ncbi:MAG: HK97 family phage prohead protease [Actinomycetota bacterium]